jgi:hypothetical protein
MLKSPCNEQVGTHPAFNAIEQVLRYRLKLICSEFVADTENAHYGACSFRAGHLSIKYRIAKTTPKKAGQFVTAWWRAPDGSAQPFSSDSEFDRLVVGVRDDQHMGQFVFPRAALAKQGVLSTPGRDGKRGFRVYPPWVRTENDQARRTQDWQNEYFLDLDEARFDLRAAQQLYGVATDIDP